MAKKIQKVKEEVIRREVRRALLDLGFDVYHPADSGFTYDARPDLVVYDSPLVVECKIFNPSIRDDPTFNLGEIRWNQRRWLETYCRHRKRDVYFAIGTATKNPFFPTRGIWVISWDLWTIFEHSEAMLDENKGNKPFCVTAGLVEKVFPEYRLHGTPTIGYTFKHDHPIRDVRGGGQRPWKDFKDFKCLLWEDATTPVAEKEKKDE